MKIGVLGTGMVGNALATKLASLGHDVMMGARSEGNEKATGWAADNSAEAGDFAQAAMFGEIIIFATLGSALIEAANLAGPENLDGKVVIDVTNPLDMSKGFPPTLIAEMANTTSAGEELQKALPGAHVVKALNTMNCEIMVDPSRVPGTHDVFYCGNDQAAKDKVAALLNSFGWQDPIDLGPLDAARGTEGMMPFWLRMYGTLGNAEFNYKIVKA
ncbi:MAG: NAD(P)-binding domain-containing protein [Hyphomicrobiales bacterium]|nr:NAD(P)-binding domain-containing protein [Hyphomicrobiales bacterium]MCP4998389.1 NAD(P)-binding domain-containing protein [Hyphomicrobiales bacterium]